METVTLMVNITTLICQIVILVALVRSDKT